MKVSKLNFNRLTENWSEKAKDRLRVSFLFLRVYALLFTVFLGILSIYWGGYYNRSSRLHNLKYLVVTNEPINQTSSLVSNTIYNITQLASMKAVGTWEVKHNLTREETLRSVHHQKYWGAIYVDANSTSSLNSAMNNADASFVAGDLVTCFYETGRDLLTVSSYILPTLKNFEKLYSELSGTTIWQPLIKGLTEQTLEKIVADNATSLLLTKPGFNLIDNRPSPSTSVSGPAQMGLIYSYVLSFHQFNFALKIHTYIKTHLKTREFVIYRIISSQITYLVLTLIYSLITLAFQVPVTRTFGHSGFLVAWAIAYLNMSALGGINEIAALIIFARNKAFIGFWIIFHLIINITPSFSSMSILPHVYRYGYAMPIHNAYEALKVVFYNTYKGQLGRNIGILVAWIVVTNSLLPFVMKNSAKKAAETAKEQEKMMKEITEAIRQKQKRHEMKEKMKVRKNKGLVPK